MTARKPLPEIDACPCGKKNHGPGWYLAGATQWYQCRCSCGWSGPRRKTLIGAILAWNRRSDAEAERRGAMKALKWLRKWVNEINAIPAASL